MLSNFTPEMSLETQREELLLRLPYELRFVLSSQLFTITRMMFANHMNPGKISKASKSTEINQAFMQRERDLAC